MSPEDIREAYEMALENGMERIEAVTEIAAPDGMTWDMEKITDDRQFIAFYLDLTQRPSPEFNIMDFLPQVAPDLYKTLTTRFERARANLMGA